MNFLSSWGPPTQPPAAAAPIPKLRTLSHSDENTPPPSPSEEKIAFVGRDALKSSGEGRTPLKLSADNVPVAPPAQLSITQRFKNLNEQTAPIFTFLAKAHHHEVDARFPREAPCLQHTRLPYLNGEDLRPLHANKVDLKGFEAICTQAPTKDNSPHFWQAVYEMNAMILDLCNDKDRSLAENKFDMKATALPYYRDDATPYKAEGWTISFKSSENVSKKPGIRFTHNIYHVENPFGERNIVRLNYSSWPDFGDISLTELTCIVEHVEKTRGKNQPLFIHCRAGVGRTGTITVALALNHLHQTGELKALVDKSGLEATVDFLIRLGREKRGQMFVSTEKQYALLHEYATYLLGKQQAQTDCG